MRAFTDIAIDYTVINQVAYPRIKLINLINVRDYNPAEDYFILYRFPILREDPEQMAAMADAVFYQTNMYYMSDNLYMSAYLYMNDFINLPAFDEPPLDISSNVTNGQYNLIDGNTDLNNYMYVYRVMSKYKGEEFASSYVAGVMHFEIKEDEFAEVDPDEVGGLMPINMGLGQIFCSDNIYTTDRKQRIYIKGLATNTVTPRYKGPIDHTVESGKRDSLTRSIEYLSSVYDNIDESIDELRSSIRDINTETYNSYRRIM